MLILDEPTSSLDSDEVEKLFEVMRRCRSEGTAIVFVSHFLDQIYEIADRMTILRNGRLVEERMVADTTQLELVQLMIGRELEVLDRLDRDLREMHDLSMPEYEILVRLSEADGDDVSQTVWLRLVEHLGDLREPAALPGWILTTARNECLRVIRARRVMPSSDPFAHHLSRAMQRMTVGDPFDLAAEQAVARTQAIEHGAFDSLRGWLVPTPGLAVREKAQQGAIACRATATPLPTRALPSLAMTPIENTLGEARSKTLVA